MKCNPSFTYIIVGLFVFATLTGCSVFKKSASEGDAMVGIGVDGRLADLVRPLTDQIFDDTIETPFPEQRFYVRYVGEDSLGFVSSWQNVVLIGALNETDPISQRVVRMLNNEATQGVIDGDLRVFRQKDVWVRGQTVVVAVAPTVDEVITWLRDNGEVMDDLLTEDRHARMLKAMYSQYEQDDLADSLREAHGWSIRIPHDYVFTGSRTDPSYARLRRHYPDRFVTVAWEPGTAETISADLLIQWRDRLGLTYPDSSRCNPIILDTVWTTLGGVDALKANGLWETYGPLGGGPFVSYLLHKDGTLYLVDGKVFAPDREKEATVRHLEVVLGTFQP
jgi:Domain of unknown function (DUF4837)